MTNKAELKILLYAAAEIIEKSPMPATDDAEKELEYRAATVRDLLFHARKLETDDSTEDSNT